MNEKLDNKKRIILVIIAVLILCVGTTLAYIIAQLQDSAKGNADVVSDTVDVLRFEVDKNITLNPNQFNVVEGGDNLSDTAIGSAILRANSTNDNATYNYYVYFQINSNNYIYTTEEEKPEIILTITDPTGSPVTSVNGLTYVESLGGFDITTEVGLFEVAELYEISSTSSDVDKIQDWTFTVTFINLDTNQYENGGKTLEGEVILSKEEYKPTLASYIIENVYVDDGVNGLYYHDTDLVNGANDNSYRYSGVNPNNYVCFGSNISECPNENLYRIIGVFNDAGDYQVKLIKSDYVTSEMLGTDSRDYGGVYVDSWGEENYYKGNMILSDIAVYRWNFDIDVSEYGSTNWATSQLNKINLNTNYLNYLGESWSNMISETNWYLGGISINDFFETAKNYYEAERSGVGYENNPVISSGKIGLMYTSDYGFANDLAMWENQVVSNGGSNNWLYMGLNEWTITTLSESNSNVFKIDWYDGGLDIPNAYVDLAVRPVFYLQSSVLYSSGDGSIDNPYRIEIKN